MNYLHILYMFKRLEDALKKLFFYTSAHTLYVLLY